MRWVGCICRTELRRARQRNGIHHNGTNTKPREVTRSRQEAGQKTTRLLEREVGFLPCSSTATKSRGVRWVGCICRTELRRARQTTGIHHSGTNTKPRHATFGARWLRPTRALSQICKRAERTGWCGAMAVGRSLDLQPLDPLDFHISQIWRHRIHHGYHSNVAPCCERPV